MQQDKNNIEEKLRQLDNQQLPDLSRMDEHWESMKLALQPGLSAKSNNKKWFWLMALPLLIGAVTLFVNRKDTLPENESPVKQISQQAEPVNNAAIPDSFIQPMPVTPVLRNTCSKKPVVEKFFKAGVENNEIDLPIQINAKDSTLTTANPNAQKILNELLSSLAKKAQEFIIDNSRDTTLFGVEGSSLLIPAKSLGGSSNVKILLKEFYKTSDIVLNKLSTTSNGEQLVTGGMVNISASVNDKPVNVLPGKTIKWFLPDTSKQMEQMQLFKGEERKAGDIINWINTGQGFNWLRNRIVVKVLDLRNEPFKTKKRKNGLIGYFSLSHDPEVSTEKLMELYREKYGYYKVRFRKEWRRMRVSTTKLIDGITYSDSPVGDSAWMSKELADKYKLPSTQSGISPGFSIAWSGSDMIKNVIPIRSRRTKIDQTGLMDSLSFNTASEAEDIPAKLEKKYSVDINSLGWINCDRFYNDSREKISYYVDLQDSAVNYFTMMVFNKMRSMMTGYMTGNQVQFDNVPIGESVKIISIGVDKKGETVMAMQETKISKKGLTGLPFESAAAPEIKSSLNKIDNL